MNIFYNENLRPSKQQYKNYHELLRHFTQLSIKAEEILKRWNKENATFMKEINNIEKEFNEFAKLI